MNTDKTNPSSAFIGVHRRLIVFLACLAAVCLAAQEPVLRVTTRVVSVSVIVQDRNGRPVADLTRDDFILLEENERQEISLFSMESAERPASSQPALPPNTYSNRLERRLGGITSATVVLLDGLNTRFQDQAYSRAQFIKFLKQLQPHDRLAIYTLTGTRLRLIHDFTSDTASLLRAFDRQRPQHAVDLAASEVEEPNTGVEELDQFLRETSQRMADFYQVRRVETTLAALEGLANHLARLPGRKNLIWVSGGFPLTVGFDSPDSIERRTFSDEIQRAVRAVNNANLAIYPVDARGLVGVFDTMPHMSPSFSGRVNPRGPPPRSRPVDHDSLIELAERTGGRAFYNTNDIRGAIRNAIDDSRITYNLGYYPRHGNWDGRFREIKVRVNRPGLRVRHRTGYHAYPEEPQDARHREAQLSAAAWSPVESAGLELTVLLLPPEPAGPRAVRLEIGLRPSELTFTEKGAQRHVSVDVLFVQYRDSGERLSRLTQTIGFDATPRKHEELVRQGIVLLGQMDVMRDAHHCRIVVRDTASGQLGSITVPLVQPWLERK